VATRYNESFFIYKVVTKDKEEFTLLSKNELESSKKMKFKGKIY
jgi:hypothetical protein